MVIVEVWVAGVLVWVDGGGKGRDEVAGGRVTRRGREGEREGRKESEAVKL